MANPEDWWRSAVTYQVYIRSFADHGGDGVGDVAGIRARLPYLQRLGVDAIWINPWYPSPMEDAGYDVADYRDVDPMFGTLAEADGLIADAHARGLRIILDIVPNHTSSAHPWFRAALAAAPGSPERDRYLFRDGRGPGGDEPPNNWISAFGGPAWTRVPDGQWYLHLFAPGQPDLNWANPAVRAEFESVLRFWFDRGVDGFRIDVANRVAKDPALPDLASAAEADETNHPYTDRDQAHDIYRGWRQVADAYDPPRVFTAEAWMDNQDRLALYLRPDELHTAFNFDFLTLPWKAADIRASVDRTRAALAAVGAPATWVLSNHDVVRHLSRFGRPQDTLGHGPRYVYLDTLSPLPVDVDLGTRRSRAAVLLLLGLPGGAYVYQGEELGLWEVEDLPDDARQDPTWEQSGHHVLGRDGCRVPLPWSGDAPPFGFGPADSQPWLPQPSAWKPLTAERQDHDPESMLSLYREAIGLRRDLRGESLRWLASPAGVLAFERDGGIGCAVNVEAEEPWPLPPGSTVLLASGPLSGETLVGGTLVGGTLSGGKLPKDTAVWFRLAPALA